MRRLLGLTAALVALLAVPALSQDDTVRPRVRLDLGTQGAIVLELRPDVAPLTVANFLELVRARYYDGLIFHRVEERVVQTGCPNGDGSGGPPWAIELESTGLSHLRGAVGMARTAEDRNSAGGQFYIVRDAWTELDGNYAIFGSVVEGMDAVDAMAPGRVLERARVLQADGAPEADPTDVTPALEAEGRAPVEIAIETLDSAPEDAEHPGLKITLGDGRVIVVELMPELAPRTVAQILAQVEAGFHDGLAFHRADAMCIQGGDPETGPREPWATTVPLEAGDRPFTRGSLGLARTPDPNSGSSQYFILRKDSPHLVGQYANFGKVLAGMGVVDSLPSRALGVGGAIAPEARVERVERVRFVTAGATAP